MGHDLITDPAYFLHAIGPSLVGLGVSAPTFRVGSIGGAELAKMIHNVLDEKLHKYCEQLRSLRQTLAES